MKRKFDEIGESLKVEIKNSSAGKKIKLFAKNKKGLGGSYNCGVCWNILIFFMAKGLVPTQILMCF